MEALLICLSPEECCNLFNGDLSVLVRKKFPKDYVGWVYIYCTKNGGNLVYGTEYRGGSFVDEYGITRGYSKQKANEIFGLLNGKVVARFWCDKVEGAYNFYVEELCQLACINKEELYKYAGGWYKTDDLLAIHITKLEIFDTPKEISEFGKFCTNNCERCKYNNEYDICNHAYKPLTRAPKTYCYIEI